MELDELRSKLANFAEARDWERFHSPKNLALALAGEVGELAALFQWLTAEESVSAPNEDEAFRDAISSEMADVLIYLVRLADVLGIDLAAAAEQKISVNEARFPPRPETQSS